MSKLKRMLSILVFAALVTSACSSMQAEQKTNEVTAQTGSTVNSVLDGVGSVIMWPFHLVGDLFS